MERTEKERKMARDINLRKDRTFSFMLLAVLMLCAPSVISLEISNLEYNVGDPSVLISWVTDEDSDSSVYYDTSDKQLLGQLEYSEDLAKAHAIYLNGLEPDTEYSFFVGSCNDAGCKESMRQTFTTLPDEDINADGPSGENQELFVQVRKDGTALPQIHNTKSISFTVKSNIGAEIFVTVDGKLKRHHTIDQSGDFFVRDLELSDGDVNTIIIRSQKGNEEISESYQIELDMIPPTVELSSLPESYLEQVYVFEGTVSEHVSVDVYVGKDGEDLSYIVTNNYEAGEISQPVDFTKGDGKYDVRLEFRDVAGNQVIKRFESYVDTEDPTIQLDRSIDSLSPSYIDKIRIKGTTEPGATVVGYVNGKTSTSKTFNANLVSMIRNLGFLLEGGRDYIVTADENGDFILDLYLSKEFKDESYLGQRFTEYDLSGRRNVTERTITNIPAWKNDIKIVAFDRAKRSSQEEKGSIILTQCDFGGDWSITISDPTPNVLVPDYLLEGIGAFGFNYNLEWNGPGAANQAEVIGRPQMKVISRGVLSQINEDEYDLGTQLVHSSTILNVFQEEMNMGSAKVNLRRFSGTMDDLEEYDSLKTMLQLDIDYEYDNFGSRGYGRQIICMPFSIGIQDDALGYLRPTKLLEGGVDALNSTVDALDDMIDIVTEVRKLVFYSSIFTNGYSTILSAKAKAACWPYYASGFVPTVDGRTVLPEECSMMEDPEECETCWTATMKYEKFEATNRKVSDRIFCPAIPSIQKYEEDNKDISKRYYLYSESGEDYDKKEDENGFSLVHGQSGCSGNIPPTYTPENQAQHTFCKDQYEREWGSACLGINDIYSYSFNDTEAGFFERFADTVDNVCRDESEFPEDIIHKMGDCCTNHSKAVKTSDGLSCFYILNPKEPEGLAPGIYEGEIDVDAACQRDPNNPDRCAKDSEGNNIIDYSKSSRSVKLYYPDNNDEPVRVDKIKDEKYQANDNPEGAFREDMADRCLQHYIMGTKGDYVIDPTSSLIRSVQCGCVPAVEQYLRHYRNMAQGTKECFQEVLLTGNTTAGFCKSVLTQYVCDLVYDAIKCGGKFFAGQAKKQVDLGKGERPSDSLGIGGIFAVFNEAGRSTAKKVQDRYGSTAVFRTLFSERQLMHSACLYAFTGSWNVEMENLFSMATASIPVDSHIKVYPAERRFITSDPFTGRATHIYHLNIGILAGADISYNVKLLCSAENTCDTETGECDCYRSGEEKMFPTRMTGTIRSGDMWTDDVYIEAASDVRYDTVVVEYRYRNNQNNLVSNVEKFKIKERGAIPLTCNFDISMKKFICDFEVGKRGYVTFGDVAPTLEGETTYGNYRIGDKILLDGEVTKRSPDYDETDPESGQERWAYLMVKVTDENDNEVSIPDNQVRIKTDGTFSLYSLMKDLNIRVKESWFSEAGTTVVDLSDGVEATVVGNLPNDVRIDMSSTEGGSNKISISSSGEEIVVDGDIKDLRHTDTYGGTYTFNVGTATITVRGQPRTTMSGATTDSKVLRASSSSGGKFRIKISLHYSDEEDLYKADFSHPVVNNGKEEEYEIAFTAVPQTSEAEDRCESSTRFRKIDVGDECTCGSASDAETCPKGDRMFCYFGKCREAPACEAVDHLDNPTLTKSIVKDSSPCYCDPESSRADWDGSTEASSLTMYCVLDENGSPTLVEGEEKFKDMVSRTSGASGTGDAERAG